ncbi:MAG: DEAD/DEAH box helicase [Deltaproteobacteria bacterium]|nr:DEAD/DEAH box helicase [Deltaproteobacteria bacterium]
MKHKGRRKRFNPTKNRRDEHRNDDSAHSKKKEHRQNSDSDSDHRSHRKSLSRLIKETFRPVRESSPHHAKKIELKGAAKQTREKLESWFKEARQMRDMQKHRDSTQIVLDDWQAEAVQALLGGANVVVDAPTTAGKTQVVDSFISSEIFKVGFRACYTCPVKSLSNDKLREFREKYGRDAVGIATGDIRENLDAPLVIATLESYRNSLLGAEPDLGRNLVIYDEYHFIHDDDRGSAWEEALILTPANCQMLLLSASLSNAGEFADWLERLSRRATVLIQVEKRPVPLANMVWYQDQWYLGESLPTAAFPEKTPEYPEPVQPQNLIPRLMALSDIGLTPCIIYAGKRLSCEVTAQALTRRLQPLDPEQSFQIGERLNQAHKENKVLSFMSPHLRRMIQSYGITYHHSGLTPQVRVAIETLVKDGLIRFCVATMGLSLGINFSVRSTVIMDAVRPGSHGFTAYSPSEVLQMTGRAGRRGRDPVGFSCWLNSEYMARFSHTAREPGVSRLKNDPTTFLGLISRGFSPGRVEQFYHKSFRYFHSGSAPMQLIRKSRILRKLGAQSLPCESPAKAYIGHKNLENTECYDCDFRTGCHQLLQRQSRNPLARLHLHLHQIRALNSEEALTPYGELARFFPQAGGLLLSSMIDHEEINSQNLLASCQLMAALSLACYKYPCSRRPDYRLPFSPALIEKELRVFYPPELFPDLYEQPGRGNRRRALGFREFNPMGGYIILLWSDPGCSWQKLTRMVCTEQFGAGDVTGLIYRTASWLQSIIQAPCGDLSRAAREMREILLREPLQVSL